MLEPADLPEAVIRDALRAEYGLKLSTLTFLPLGNDPSVWVYRAHMSDGTSNFLKVRRAITNPPSLLVPRYLHDHGVPHIVAPLPTRSGSLWTHTGRFALILYPFIDGQSGRDRGMTEHHWSRFGAALRQFHDTTLPPDLMRQMQRDTYTPAWAPKIQQVDAVIAGRTFEDAAERELAAFWRARRDEIVRLVERAEALGQRLHARAPRQVLCHADMHTWNVLIDTADQFWIVDWDDVVIAPRERDLMFVVGGIADGLVSSEEEHWFRTGYGEINIDPLALAYYRYAWAVSDTGAYGEHALLLSDTGPADKRRAIEGLISLFNPGQIVALAYAADRAEW